MQQRKAYQRVALEVQQSLPQQQQQRDNNSDKCNDSDTEQPNDDEHDTGELHGDDDYNSSSINNMNNNSSSSSNYRDYCSYLDYSSYRYSSADSDAASTQKLSRKLGVSFWIAGLLNNAGYVIMLASAKSISEGGVGLVFLANILPALVVKVSAPYWFERIHYQTRIGAATWLAILSFGIVASSTNLVWQLCGVACASAQCSLGEASLLALAGKLDGELAELETKAAGSSTKGTCLNGFSSGTGFAGVFGFFWKWFWCNWLGLSLSSMLWLATVLAAAYFATYKTIAGLKKQKEWMLAKIRYKQSRRQQSSAYSDNDESNGDANTQRGSQTELVSYSSNNNNDSAETMLYGSQNEDEDEDEDDDDDETTAIKEISSMGCSERFYLVLQLWPYMVPLFTVYVAEYTLQSGTWTAIGFPVTDKDARNQFYTYSNWTYQVGVFISRSSGSCFVAPMTLLWAMPVLQCLNVGFYWAAAVHQAHANDTDDGDVVWSTPLVLYGAALYTGLLGGAVYIHGYLRICKDLPLQHREFALSATSLAESLGIVVADALGLLVQACLYEINHLEGAITTCPTTMTTSGG